jgi:predicted ATPase/DNA-binding XRE family transcriptional regulator
MQAEERSLRRPLRAWRSCVLSPLEGCDMSTPLETGLEDSGGMAKASFGQLLRAHRRKAGFSQEYLADRARMSAQTVGALERGIRVAPYRATVELLAMALELSPNERAQFDAVAERARQRGDRHTRLVRSALHNLPVQLTSFVGREAELERLAELLSTNRLVTITGLGGIGKTRIALEAAARYLQRCGDEVCFVDLSALTDGRFVASKIAASVEPPVMGGDGTIAWISAVLKNQKLLLILDNCEHLIDDVVAAARVLLQTRGLMRIMPTSREVLGLKGEVVLRVPPLPLRDVSPTGRRSDEVAALELFRERASTANADLRWDARSIELATDICRRLDGIPLALELVAACLPALGLRDLSARLSNASFKPALRRDLPARQQTMAATIQWSYDLLKRSEQMFFRRLAIFAGDFTLEAADTVCSDDPTVPNGAVGLLSSLVDKSLVGVVRRAATTRCSMLETVRAFGLAQLETQGERTGLARRHARWLSAYAEATPRHYLEMPSTPIVAALWPELDNIRAALDWSLGSAVEDDILLGGRILAGLRALWIWSGRLAELRSWTETALARIDAHRYPYITGSLRWGLLQTLTGAEMLEAAQGPSNTLKPRMTGGMWRRCTFTLRTSAAGRVRSPLHIIPPGGRSITLMRRIGGIRSLSLRTSIFAHSCMRRTARSNAHGRTSPMPNRSPVRSATNTLLRCGVSIFGRRRSSAPATFERRWSSLSGCCKVNALSPRIESPFAHCLV